MSKQTKEQNMISSELVKSLLDQIDPADYKRTAIRMRAAGAIAEQLAACGLSKTQFAKNLNVQPSVITKWLSGTHNFTIDTLADISDVLKISVADFFTKPEEPVLYSTRFAVKGHSSHRMAGETNKWNIMDSVVNESIAEYKKIKIKGTDPSASTNH